jgi:hypothetical protein
MLRRPAEHKESIISRHEACLSPHRHPPNYAVVFPSDVFANFCPKIVPLKPRKIGKAAGNSAQQTLARKEWDFREVPPEQIEACFLYEYARESSKIRELSKWFENATFDHSDYQDDPEYFQISRLNPRCAWLLSLIAPHLRLAETPWQLIDKKKIRGGFGGGAKTFRFLASWEVGCVKWDELGSNYPDDKPTSFYTGDGCEWACIEIDWDVDFSIIKADAIAWLEERLKAKGLVAKKGRHAKKSSYWQDGLRQLGALRLLAHYPLKKAIEISKGYQKKDSIYSGYIDSEGRPAHQTAWDKACKSAVEVFQNTFGFQKSEKPICWDLWQKRRRKNRN